MSKEIVSLALAFAFAASLPLNATAGPRAGLPIRHVKPLDVAPASGPCSASMQPIKFSTPSAVAPIIVSVTCPSGVNYQVGFTDANGCSAVRKEAQLQNVSLQLLLPSGAVWCDGTGGTAVATGVGTGAPQSYFGTARVVSDTSKLLAGSYNEPIQLQVLTTP
ncbi:MAG: hypothetical protein JO322_12895 [Candidatus Eremiobacteraeota bacterium]|nr:hypothetical protein [Candidatus Eremiobacteraeota bacterium]